VGEGKVGGERDGGVRGRMLLKWQMWKSAIERRELWLSGGGARNNNMPQKQGMDEKCERGFSIKGRDCSDLP
jgi:hypothetical protein